MYRKDIKVMDCTIRDGGLMNKWKFSDEFVSSVYKACVEGGIDYMEFGYKTSEKYFSKEEFGPWKFCEDKDIRRIVGENKTNTKISVMVDIGRVDQENILPKSKSVIDMVRVAAYLHQIDKAIVLAEQCIDKGYETSINLMAVSKVNERDLDEALSDVAKSKVPIFYLVDSFGSLYCEQIELFAKKYLNILKGKILGIHAHNNMQLAFSNTITAVINGCSMLDATLLGLGRGAGNCPIEILIAFLKNPKYRLLPLFQAIQDQIIPLQKKIDWGYHIPYLVTGAMNEHPKEAMAWMESEKKNDFVGFLKHMHDNFALLE
jgi:4-hydroxy 2-oxovalerate aldolase